jgi:alpha-mannosidase
MGIVKQAKQFEKITAFVVPHSHYDYLWCDPPDAMGAKNAKLIEEALLIMRKHPEYRYIIDSAMAVEYFRLNYPDMMDELKQRVREKRIELMGGMVVAPDTMLPGGETLARQFLYGMGYFRDVFGVEPTTGFLIDSFSMTPQLPQFLAKAGLQQFVFCRGAIRRNLPQEFWWKAPDGSKVLAHWMRINYGYVLPPFNGTILAPVYPFFPIPFTIALIPQHFRVYELLKKLFPPFKILFQWILRMDAGAYSMGSDIGGFAFTIKRRAVASTTRNVLVLCGTDNLPPSTNVIDAVDYMHRASNRYDTRMALPADFFDAVRRDRQEFSSVGPCEMTGYMDKFTGTYSCRPTLKRKIRALEQQLYTTEAAATIASTVAGFMYPKDEITTAAWRLLRVCFHDGIPGCHVDNADDHIVKQLDLSSKQLARIARSALAHIAGGIDVGSVPDGERPVLVFNPVAASRGDVVSLQVDVDPSTQAVKDGTGEPVPCQVDSLSPGKRMVIRCHDVPPAGYALYSIGKGRDAGTPESGSEIAKSGDATVEVTGKNFTLLFSGGKLRTIKDANGFVLLGSNQYAINDLRIFDDRGDSYLTGRMPKKVFTTTDNSIDVVENGPVRTVVSISSTLQCKKWFSRPAGRVMQYFILHQDGTPRIDFITRIENRAHNIRIQACFPVCIKHPVFASEVPYGHITRDIEPVKGFSMAMFKKAYEHYDRIFPVINWMDASDATEEKGMTIINSGQMEFEIARSKDHLFLTLVRSTGYVGSLLPGAVPQLLGPFYAIPKAYELTTHECRYSLFFHDGHVDENNLTATAMACNIPLEAKLVEGHTGGEVPATASIVSVEPATFTITAIKQAEADPGDIIVRVLETSNQEGTGRLIIGFPIESASVTDLLEKPVKELQVSEGNSIEFEARAQEILTVRMRFAPRRG